jgi:hypothetical protein
MKLANQLVSTIARYAALIAFANCSHSQTPLPPTPPTEAYKPDPITTTSKALEGKLFFNDSERARTDKARKDIAAGKVIYETDNVDRVPTLSGFIKRSDGVATYWINGAGATDTRFVAGIDKTAPNEILATSTMVGGEPKFVCRQRGDLLHYFCTSTMVGGEPKFVLTGTTVGEAKVDDVKPKATLKKQKKATSKKTNLKKTDTKKSKKRVKNKRDGDIK